MKKLFFILFVFFAGVEGYGQYPITQNLGSGSTLVRVPTPGGFQASLVNRNFVDTTAANLTPISFYPGAQIYATSTQTIWVRNNTATGWIELASGASSTTLYTGDGTLLSNRTVSGDGKNLLFDNILAFSVGATGSINLQSGNQFLQIIGDTANFDKRVSYSSDIDHTAFTQHTLVDKDYVESMINPFDATVDFSVNANPNTVGTTFSPNTPQLTTKLYVSTINGSQWTYNGTTYVIYIPVNWSTFGNAGTTAGTNFLGTTDAVDFVGKTNGTERFRWGSGGGYESTFTGAANFSNTSTSPTRISASNGVDSSFISVRRFGTSTTFVDIRSIRSGQEARFLVGGILQGGAGIFANQATRTQSFTVQGDINMVDSDNSTGRSNIIHMYNDSIHINPSVGNLLIDTLLYTLSTTGKKIMLRDTATGLVQNIDPALLLTATPTFQQVLTAGSTLTTDNKVTIGNNSFTIVKTGTDTLFRIDPVNLQFTFGDGSGVGNATSIKIDDATTIISLDGKLRVQSASPYDFSTSNYPIYWAQGSLEYVAGWTVDSIWRASSDSIRFRVLGVTGSGKAGTFGIYAPTGGSGGSPAGNFGNLQINRNGAFDTPASDSLTFLSTGFTSVAGAFSFTGGGARVYGNDAFGGAILRYGAGDANAVVVQSGTIGLSTSFNNRVAINDASTTVLNRLRETQGADVASAAGAIALGTDGNSFEITGTASITLISNTNWANGSEVTLVFTSTATLVDGTANSGTDIGMELEGNTNFVGSAGTVVKLTLLEVGGTQRWRMSGKSVN